MGRSCRHVVALVFFLSRSLRLAPVSRTYFCSSARSRRALLVEVVDRNCCESGCLKMSKSNLLTGNPSSRQAINRPTRIIYKRPCLFRRVYKPVQMAKDCCRVAITRDVIENAMRRARWSRRCLQYSIIPGRSITKSLYFKTAHNCA